MNNYKLIEASTGDENILSDLMEEFYAEDNQKLDKAKAHEAFAELLKSQAFGRAWLIEVDGTIRGYIVLTFSFAMEFYGRDGFIDDFFIKKEFRCQGIGKRVLKDIGQIALKENIKVLFLEAHDTLKPHLLDFYGSVGFKKRPCRLLSKTLN